MKFDFTTMAPPAEKKTWKETIVDRIKDGIVVPIISNSYMNDLAFSSHEALLTGWASYTQYPMVDQKHDLPQMTQYESISKVDEGQISDPVQIREKYLNFLKMALSFMAERDPKISANERDELEAQARDLNVSEMAWRLNYPTVDSAQENPLLLLADLPISIYLTSSYHNFLEMALKKAQKEPQTEICHWHEGLRSIGSIFDHDSEYEPTPKKPLVYHLHGLDEYPESLVLTEDDHLDFLANISKDNNAIHPRIKRALSESSLIMLGYQLDSWDFKVIFRGVIKSRPPSLWKTSVAIQIGEKTPEQQEYVKKYLRQVKFEVEWTKTDLFIQKLYRDYNS